MFEEKPAKSKKYILLGSIGVLILLLILFHIWLHITNPYARWNIVQQPYTTSVDKNGQIQVQKQFDLTVHQGAVAQLFGYYKSGFLIVQNTYFGSKPAQSSTLNGIIGDIHSLRFNPSKPYIISGDQFSVLYPRNMGVFYNSTLNPYTALNQKDWENRQRLFLQSALYALDAFSDKHTLTTTIVPSGPRSVALTEVHPGSVPSDSLYGILYTFDALTNEAKYPNAPHKLQAKSATEKIINARHNDLKQLLAVYLAQVQNPHTKMVKQGIDLSGARDGAVRDRSFYDNVVLWKTLELADTLGVQSTPKDQLDTLRATIVKTYWDSTEGHFKDDLASHPKNQNYASDWLIALPTGFLNPTNPADLPYLQKSVAFIHKEQINKPFPIKYQAAANPSDIPWAVKTFVPNYGGDAIWGYWGVQYVTALNALYQATHDQSYYTEAKAAIATYSQKIVENQGFPETYTPQGDFLQTPVYKSIRQTGWVVQFEQAKYELEHESIDIQ